MTEDNGLPLLIIAVLVGVLLVAFFLPPDVLDVRPDSEDPVANAGPNLTVNCGMDTVLDGSGSSDDKGIQSYEWKIENGPQILFLRGEIVKFSFGAPGEYKVTLTVTDHADKQDSDDLLVTVL